MHDHDDTPIYRDIEVEVFEGWDNSHEPVTRVITLRVRDDFPPPDAPLPGAWMPTCTATVPVPDAEEWLPQWDELLPGEKARVYAVCAMTGEDWDPHLHPRDHPGPPPGQTYRQHLHRVLAQQLASYMAGRRREQQ